MVDQGTVDCNKLKTLDVALGEKQAVKRVPGRRLGVEGVENVRDFDPEYLQSDRRYGLRQITQWHTDVQLAKPGFYCDFPKSCGTDEAVDVSNVE